MPRFATAGVVSHTISSIRPQIRHPDDGPASKLGGPTRRGAASRPPPPLLFPEHASAA